MYHIKNDRRTFQSAGLICLGFTKLLKHCNYDAISISQLAEEAGVGRATFYRLFDGKSDVVLYQMESVFDEMLDHFGLDTDPDVVIETLFKLWLEQKDLFLALIEANLYESFQTKLAFIIEEKLAFIKESIQLDNKKWHYFIQIRAAMLFTALRVAITQYTDDSASDIMKMLNDLFGNQQMVLFS